jgi:cytochrome c
VHGNLMPRVWSAWSALLAVLLLGGCGLESEPYSGEEAAMLTGGDPGVGRARLRDYGCGACHTIPGVVGADTKVAPPLDGFSGRMYIAGLLPNNPENLMAWIQDPPAIDSLTAMPNVGVTAADARHIAAYLYTLK